MLRSASVAAILFVLGACGGGTESTSAPPPSRDTATQQPPVPDSPLAPVLAESIGGWRRNGLPRTWGSAELHHYLGPEADRWRMYQLFDVVVGSYDRADGSIAIVELYRFRAPSSAFGAYSTRRGFDSRIVAVGNEGFSTTHSLLAWKGNVVLRIVGKSADGAALENLGRLVAGPLGEGSAKPAELGFLIGMHVVPGTEVWTLEDALGHAMFRNSAMARIRTGDSVIDVLRHPCRNAREAQANFEEFRSSVTHSAKTIDPVLGVGNEAFFAQDTHLANTLAFRAGVEVVVLRGQAPPEAFIRAAEAIASRLRAIPPPVAAPAPVSVP